MGSPWRSAHELIVVFKKPSGKKRKANKGSYEPGVSALAEAGC
jgi:hypothetical protein